MPMLIFKIFKQDLTTPMKCIGTLFFSNFNRTICYFRLRLCLTQKMTFVFSKLVYGKYTQFCLRYFYIQSYKVVFSIKSRSTRTSGITRRIHIYLKMGRYNLVLLYVTVFLGRLQSSRIRLKGIKKITNFIPPNLTFILYYQRSY